jgi:hypothetical protein
MTPNLLTLSLSELGSNKHLDERTGRSNLEV